MRLRYLKNDIDARALGGILLHNGMPCLVKGWTEEEGYELKNLQDERRSCKVKQLDMGEVQLGNVQLGKAYAYIARIPYRRYKQTISLDNTKKMAMPFDVRELKDVRDLYQVEYPKIEVALKHVVDKELLACCFHKEFGFFRRGDSVYLAYRNFEVGVVKNNKVSLYEKKFYLKELLNEVFNAA